MEVYIAVIVALTSLLTAFATSATVAWRLAVLHREISELRTVLRIHGIWYEIGHDGHATRSFQQQGAQQGVLQVNPPDTGRAHIPAPPEQQA